MDARSSTSRSTTTLRAAIVGSGLMGRWHAKAIAQSGARIVAVADLDLEAARRLASQYRGAQAFADVETMLQQTQPDVLHICTPLDTHRSFAEMALKAGCHVFVEKPVAPSLDETQSLLKNAARRGLLVCPVHQFAFQDGVLQAHQWLPGLGRLVHIDATFCSAGGVGHDVAALDDIVADILPHPLSLFQVFLSGLLPTEGWTTCRPAPGELRVSGVSSGVTVSLFISMNARPTESSLSLLGTNGKIHLDLFHGYAFRQTGQVSKLRKIVHPFDQSLRHFTSASLNLVGRTVRGESAYPGLRRLVGDFYGAIRSGEVSPISPTKTVEVARIREMLMNQADSPNPVLDSAARP